MLYPSFLKNHKGERGEEKKIPKIRTKVYVGIKLFGYIHFSGGSVKRSMTPVSFCNSISAELTLRLFPFSSLSRLFDSLHTSLSLKSYPVYVRWGDQRWTVGNTFSFSLRPESLLLMRVRNQEWFYISWRFLYD